MTKLFVSHASEDKEDFVQPLVDALTPHFEVWFAPCELKLGESLRSKIDAALQQSDFGVVVLSPAFFAKKWPVAELNGLFALETSNRKLILPVWYQVGEADVKAFSPMLADRMAADAAQGIGRVVEEIRIATEASQRTQEIVLPDAGRRAMNAMMQTLLSRELDRRVLGAESGAPLFWKAFQRVCELIWEQLQTANANDKRRFHLKERGLCFVVDGPYGVRLSLATEGAGENYLENAKVVFALIVRANSFEDKKELILDECSFLPSCLAEDRIGFRDEPPGSPIQTQEQLAIRLLDRFCVFVDSRAKQAKND